MDIKTLTPFLSVSPQLSSSDIGIAAARGFRAIVCNRPDGEGDDQPDHEEMAAACERHGLEFRYQPVVSGQIGDQDIQHFATSMGELTGPVLAYCRTGTRCATLWALSTAPKLDVDAILNTTAHAGYDLSAQRQRLQQLASERQGVNSVAGRRHDVVIIGGGTGGQAVASSLIKRQPDLDIAIVEPRSEHFYQPGWTLVGGGVFQRSDTSRPMQQIMPKDAHWYHAACSRFVPEQQHIVLEDGECIGYRILVVAPGLKLNWDAIDGIKDTLGQHGVTSNYVFDLAPYTWELVQNTSSGTALFTQPAMPIKCAGAPQKAMYLSCDHWQRQGRLGDMKVEFCNAGGVLFGVADYVPALQSYIDHYGIQVNYFSNLIAVDGQAKTALFNVSNADGEQQTIEKSFDMLHVCPPQCAPDFIADSPLAGDGGWLELNSETLQHSRYGNIFGLGDVGNTPNAKTAAAIRKQAPVVAENIVMVLNGESPRAVYNGYGACPLTVERGKIVLAEFCYGGQLDPTLPRWLIEGTQPTRLAWHLKEKVLPWVYWNALLKGREWLVQPTVMPRQAPAQEGGQTIPAEERR